MGKLVASKLMAFRVSTIALAIGLLSVFLFSYSVSASSTGAIVPTSNGNYLQWTPSSGTSHFAMVDETPCNGTTDYNSTTGVGNRDSYSVSLSSVPNGATITQIDIKPCASRVANGGTNPVMNVFYRANGTDSADSGSYSLTGTTPTELATTSYSSLSITKGAATTLEIGAVLTSGTKGARLSRIATTLTYTALTAPTNLSGSATTSSAIKLSWTDTSSNETGFNVERSTDALNWTPIATTSANAVSYYDSGLTASTTYYHRVRAFNSGAYTSYSNVATTTTADTIPNAPFNLAGTATTSSAVDLIWSDNSSNETGFKVERSTDALNWSPIATTPANAAVYHDSGLSAATTYYHRVRAFNSVGNSGYSNISTTTTLDNVPAAPSGLASSATTSSAINLTWIDNSSNESGFNVERSLDAFSWLPVATTSTNATAYYDPGLSAATTYYHRVRAFNSVGYSSYSNASTATTTDNPPTAPSALSATASATSPTIALGWTDNSSNETNFEVLRSFDGISFSHLATTSADAVAYNNTGLASSTTHYYEVRAYNSAGYSGVSNTASDTTGTLPTSASNLMLTSSTTALRIDLAWTDNSSNELNFRLEQSTTSPTSGFSLVSILSANTTSTSYTPLFSNTLYYFRILTGNGYGTTTSDVASTTSASLPSAPSGLSLSTQPGMGTTTDIILNWSDNSSNELGFKVERSTGGAFSQIATTSADVITYTDPSHSSGTYSYRLRAYNGVGNSAYSNTASTTIP